MFYLRPSLASRCRVRCASVALVYCILLLVIKLASCVTSPKWSPSSEQSATPDSEPPLKAAERLHELLELIQDGKIYPVLSEDEPSSHNPPTAKAASDENDPGDIEYETEYNQVTDPNLVSNKEDANTSSKTNEQSKPSSKKPSVTIIENNNVEDFNRDVSNEKTDKEIKVQNKDNDVKVTRNGEVHYEREKREAKQSENKTSKSAAGEGASSRRVKTGDTILNIRGAVRDSIGDAAAPAPAPAAPRASRIDTFVIRPSQHQPPPQPRLMPLKQQPNIAKSGIKELVVEPHSIARIPCNLQNVTNIRWYKDGEVVSVSKSGSVGASAWWAAAGGVGDVSVRAGRGEAGRWRCAGDGGASGAPVLLTLYERVRGVYLMVDGRRLDAGNTWVPVRDKTLLEVVCVADGGVPAPELQWRLAAADPNLDPRLYLRYDATNHSTEGVRSSRAVVTAARELHNASLQCAALQPSAPSSPSTPTAPSAPSAPSPHPLHTPHAKLQVHVTYPPSFVISRWPGFGVSLAAGGSAALRCDVDANPPARAWWQRDGHLPSSSPAPLEAGDDSSAEGAEGATAATAATLRWSVLSAAHAGWYRCRATWADTDYSSIGYYLNVISGEEGTEPVPPSKSSGGGVPAGDDVEHQRVDVPLGGAVQLHCPKGSVGCWWRRVSSNSNSNSSAAGEAAQWAPAGSQNAHGVLGIKDAIYQEGGEYRCLGTRGPDANRLRELKRVTVKITGGPQASAVSAVRLATGGWRVTCAVCGRGALAARWLLGGGGGGGAGGGGVAGGAAGSGGRWERASLAPDLERHCWRAELTLPVPLEVWCVVSSADGGGAVAVFPAPPAPPAPPAHSPRALAAADGAPPVSRRSPLALLALALALYRLFLT